MTMRTDRAPVSAMSARWESWRRGAYRFRSSALSLVGLAIVTLLMLTALFGAELVPYPEHVAGRVVTSARLRPPSATHWFGTNEVGQDVFSLVVAGTRISMLAGLAVVLIGAAIGLLVGLVAGYFGGWIDEALMRIADLIMTIPSLILAMAVAAALGQGLVNLIIAISLSWWPGFARLVRGEVLGKKEELFVQAARAAGASHARVIAIHVLPNIMSPVIVKMSLDMGFAILTVAALGFIGIGVRPPMPEWGTLLSTARGYLPDYWWPAIFPGCAIFLAVFGFNLLGDGLRDVLDPRARR
jgi:peptide/nickel transport system permease protein